MKKAKNNNDELNVYVCALHDGMDVPNVIDQTFKTRLTKDGEQFTTTATFNFDGVTMGQLQALAIRSLVINAQAVYRTTGHVPPVDTIKVADMLAKERSTGGKPMSVEKLASNIGKMSTKDKARILALLSD